MNKIKSVTKLPVWPMTILMTAIMAGCGGGSGGGSAGVAPAAGLSSALGASVASQALGGAKSQSYSLVSTTPNITVTGTHAGDVASVLTGGGFINVANNGAHVAATQTGTGTISITNNGQVIAATNKGTGAMTINNTDTGAVTVTNTGNGNITVNATGTTPLSIVYTDNLDHTYPVGAAAVPGLGSSIGNKPGLNINVIGSVAGIANVSSVITGGGTINVTNNGAHVAATQTGLGIININNSVGVLAATNTGKGTMTITNTDTGAVAVTRTGNGNTTVTVGGTTPLALTFNGDGDVIYPLVGGATLASSLGTSANANITVSGSAAGNVAPVLNGGGAINVVNNGAHVAATQTGTGSLNIVNNGGVMAATNTGKGVMTINSTDTASVAVTNTGVGSSANNITVTASGTGAIACAFTDGLNHVVNLAVATNATVCNNSLGLGVTPAAGLGSSLGAVANANAVVSGSKAGNVTTTINGGGFINVINDGEAVTATETGAGTITVVNNTGAGGLTATNNGNGLMTIISDATAAVTVTNTGNGNVNVTATGSNPITLTHNGDDNFTYPLAGVAGGALGAATVTPLSLGKAGNFEILTKTGITNTGGSTIAGNIGASGITAAAMSNVTCPEVNGGAVNSVYGDDAGYAPVGGVVTCYATGDTTTAAAAVLDMVVAYNDAASGTQHPATVTELLGGNLVNGTTLVPGTYKWSTVVAIPAAATITLNGGPNDVWIFQAAGGVTLIGDAVTPANAAKVVLIGGAVASNVFWASASTVAIGANATMNGVVLSQTNITLGTGATVHGKLLAQTNVTLIANTVAP